MYIKIYFSDKPLFLCDAISPELEPFLHHDDAVLIEEFSTPAINSMIYEMELPKIHAGLFLHKDLESLKKAFWKKFVVIKAGGAVVWNEAKDLLFIHRRGKWDLPKGKLDDGESIETCALRELEEETGLKGAKISKPLITTYHTYHESGKHILKETYWFEMQSKGNHTLTPQTLEDIQDIQWLPKSQWDTVRTNTFPSIKDVLDLLHA